MNWTSLKRTSVVVPAVLGLLLVWAYWTTLAEMAERWVGDPQYSHGYLVPLFAGYLLYSRRERLKQVTFGGSWWGVAVLATGVGLRLFGTYFYLPWFDALSLLVCLAGLALVAGGWPGLRWSWPAVLFLFFMLPLPYGLQTALGGSLQRVATRMSTYCLQTVGAPAVSEGNIILLNDTRIGVVEACNGLGMLVTFFALATAVALWINRSWLVKLIVVASAVPVAVLANVARITVTGLLYDASQDRLAQVVFHDIAGLLMMPVALLLIFLELHVLGRLVIDRAEAKGPAPIPVLPGGARPGPVPRATSATPP